MTTNSFSHGYAVPRPSAFRLPASRTAGGKRNALKEGAICLGYFLSRQYVEGVFCKVSTVKK